MEIIFSCYLILNFKVLNNKKKLNVLNNFQMRYLHSGRNSEILDHTRQKTCEFGPFFGRNGIPQTKFIYFFQSLYVATWYNSHKGYIFVYLNGCHWLHNILPL